MSPAVGGNRSTRCTESTGQQQGPGCRNEGAQGSSSSAVGRGDSEVRAERKGPTFWLGRGWEGAVRQRHEGTPQRGESLLTKPSIGEAPTESLLPGSSRCRAAGGTPTFGKAEVQKPDLSHCQT